MRMMTPKPPPSPATQAQYAVTIDPRAGIHITTPTGVGRLAILAPDGSIIDTPALTESLRIAMIDAILKDLAPTLQKVSRRLSPPDRRDVAA